MLDRPTIILREATSRPASWNATARTIEVVAATSAPVVRRDAQGTFDEILDPRGADLEGLVGASVLDAHRSDNVRNVLGVVESARVEGEQIIATLRMSERSDIAGTVKDIADGILRNLSVGYSVQSWQDGTAGGRRTRTATKWSPREISFVPIGADSNAKTRTSPMDTLEGRPVINRTIRELAQRAGVAASITDDLIDREASIEEARQVVLDDVIKRGATRISSAGHQTTDDPEFFRASVTDALYARMTPGHKPSAGAVQFVGMSAAEIARVCLQRAGVSTMGLGGDTLITRALQSTSDYPSVLMNVIDKSMRVAYEAAPSGIKPICRATTNLDFRAKFRIMLDSSGVVLAPVSETGEFRNTGFVDGSESYSVGTYGDIFAISRQALVNDNLNAFGDLSRRLGIAAAQFENTFLANLLVSNPTLATDSTAVFNAAHNNYVAPGSGAVPSVATLTAARIAMRHQTGLGKGYLIDIVPDTLIVGAELESAAQQLVETIYPPAVTAANPFNNLKQILVEPRLTNTTAWYLCDSRNGDIEYAHLASSPGPQVESRLGFRVDGLEVRIRLDFGGGFVDFRGLYLNAGI